MASFNIHHKEETLAEIKARHARIDEWFESIKPIVSGALGDTAWIRYTDDVLEGGMASARISLHDTPREDEYLVLKPLADALDASGVPFMWAAGAWETGDGQGNLIVRPYLAINIPAFQMPPIPSEWWYTEPTEAIAV